MNLEISKTTLLKLKIFMHVHVFLILILEKKKKSKAFFPLSNILGRTSCCLVFVYFRELQFN